MRKSTLLKHLDQLDESSLREELIELYTKYDVIKEHYKMELGSSKDRERIFVAAKKAIDAKFKTKSVRKPRKPRIQKINSIIAELNKRVIFNYEMIDIHLYTTEKCLDFMRDYYMVNQVLINHVSKNMKTADALIEENLMLDKYRDEMKRLLNVCSYFEDLNDEIHYLLVKYDI